MKNILHISTSPNGQNSFSIKLGNAIAQQLTNTYPSSTISITDLTENPFPHLDTPRVKAIRTRGKKTLLLKTGSCCSAATMLSGTLWKPIL